MRSPPGGAAMMRAVYLHHAMRRSQLKAPEAQRITDEANRVERHRDGGDDRRQQDAKQRVKHTGRQDTSAAIPISVAASAP